MSTKSMRYAAAAMLVLMMGAVSAQDAPSPLQVTTIKVKPGMNGQFEEAVQAVIAAADKVDSDNYWLASQSVSGEPVYTITTAMDSFAALGEPPLPAMIAEAMGEGEAERIGGLIGESVESTYTAFYNEVPALSLVQRDTNEAPDAVVYFYLELNPGMAQQYAEVAAQTREAAMALAPDLSYIVQMPGMGARNTVRVVGLVEDWADLDTGLANPGQLVIQHFGEVIGNALIARNEEAMASIYATLNRTRPDLSRQPSE